MIRISTAAAIAAACSLAFAHEMGPGGAHVGDIMIENAYARAPAAPGGAGAAFMSIRTMGAADAVVAASSPAAARVALHTHTVDDQGVARMREIAAIPVAPDAPAVLEPGGLHVMLMGVTQDLAVGDLVEITLTFETTGDVTVQAPVKAMRRGHAHGGHGDGGHGQGGHGRGDGG